LNGSVTIASLTLGPTSFIRGSGNNDITITGALNSSGSNLIGGTGNVTVGGLVNLPTISGSQTNVLYLEDNRILTMNGGGILAQNSVISSGSINTTVVIPINKTLILNSGTGGTVGGTGLGAGTLINHGTIEKNGAFVSFWDAIDFQNTGTIIVNEGQISVDCNGAGDSRDKAGTHTGATFKIAAGAVYDQIGGNHSYTNCTMQGTTPTSIGSFYIGGCGFCGCFNTDVVCNLISGNTISTEFELGNAILNLTQNITLADVDMISGTINGTGTLTIPTGGHAELSGTLNIPFINQGTINVNAIFNNTFSNSGIIQSKLNGIGSLGLNNAIVTNTGTFSPGNPESGFPIGYINVQSFNNSTSTLAIELAGYSGPSLGIGNDRLYSDNVNLLTLSGTLNISFINGFTPILNDVFTIMTCSNGCSGNFSSIVSPISPTTMWQVDVTTNPNEVRIKLVPIPPTVCTWNGTTGNWSDATKWSCGQVPTSNNNVVINGGTVTLDGANGTTVSIVDMTLSGGTLTSINNNTLALSGALTWSGGTISGTGTMTVAMATTITNAPILDTRSLTLNGGGTIADGFNTSNGANLIIPLSKTLTVTTNAINSNTSIIWGGNGGTLTLAGTLVKAGVGILECNFQNVQNTGTMNINEGYVRLGYGGTHNGATVNTTINTFCSFSGGTHTFTNCNILGTGGFAAFNDAIISTFTGNTVGTSLFNIGGTCAFNLGQNLNLNAFSYFGTNTLTGTGNITTNIAGIYNGTLGFTGNLNIGSLTWSGGTIGSTVHTTLPPGSVGTTSNTVTTNGRFTISGMFTVQSGIFNANGIFDNDGGTMTIQSGTVNAGGEFGNFGDLVLQTGSFFNANADFYNSYSLTIQSGTFTAHNAFINSADLIIESGTLNAVGAFTNEFGTIEVGQAGTLHATNTFVVTQGTIKGRGLLNLSADLINTDDATIAPGLSPGTLTINPSVSSTSDAIYEMEITGNDADKLISTGNIALGGTLKLVLSNPAIGIYTIFNSTSGSVSGYPSPNLSVLYSVNGGAFSATPPPNMSITQPNANNIVVNITGSVLPVELLAFKAQNTEGGNLLTWQTANEINNKGFQIERSIDGKTFETIGFVQAKGVNSTYSFIDKRPLSIKYYRLRQMDNDGKETVSKVITVNLQQKGFFVKVYPNPFRGNLMLDLSTDKKTDVTIELIDILGRHVYQSKAENTEGVVSMPLSTEGLANGTYFLKVSDGQQTI
jgi:fibronectin-binding autotransporter adhesin